MKMIRRIFSVATHECFLQWRSFPFWILIILPILIALPTSALFNPPRIPVTIAQVSVYSGIVSFIPVLLPFLFIPLFQRDQQRHMRPLIWTRPVPSAEYTIGKTLAALFLVGLTEAFLLFIMWGFLSLQRGELLPVTLVASIYAKTVIWAVLATLITITILQLIKNGLVAAFLSSALMIAVMLFGSKSQTTLISPNALLFYSQSIGFGPDTPMILLQAGFVCLLIIFCFGLLLAVSQWRERQGATRWPYWLLSALLCIGSLGFLIPTANAFQQTTGGNTDLGAITTPPMEATFAHYYLQVKANLDSAQLEGSASFELLPQQAGNEQLSFGLNPGLSIQSITTNNTSLPWQTSQGWTSIDLRQTPSFKGEAITLTIRYSGTLLLNRNNYLGAGGGMVDRLSREHITYRWLGNGFAFFDGNGAGGWYPLPWTKQGFIQFGTHLPFDEVRLSIPSNVQVWHSVGTIQISEDKSWQDVIVGKVARLPDTFVTAVTSPQSITIEQTPVFYRGLNPDKGSMRTYTMIIKQLQELNRWLPVHTEPSSGLQAIVVPFLNDPIISGQILLLPEYALNTNTGMDLQNDRIALTYASTKIAKAWWNNALPQPTIIMQDNTIFFYEDDLAGPRAMLAGYTSEVIASKTIGQAHYDAVHSICQERQKYTKNSIKSADVEFVSVLDYQLKDLGLESCSQGFIAMTQFAEKEGLSKLGELLATYVEKETQEASFATQRTFVSEMSRLLGRDFAPDFGLWFCKETNDTDPLWCLPADKQGA